MKKKTLKRLRGPSREVNALLMKVSIVGEQVGAVLNRLELLREQLSAAEGPTPQAIASDITKLTEENQRLQKEQHQLRQFIWGGNPPVRSSRL